MQMVLQAAGTGSTYPAGESGFFFTQSVLGSTGVENVFLIDGIDTTSPTWGGSQVGYPTNAVQEVAFESGGFGAEFGRASASVSRRKRKSGNGSDDLVSEDRRHHAIVVGILVLLLAAGIGLKLLISSASG